MDEAQKQKSEQPLNIVVKCLINTALQTKAALAIHGFVIRGFDYSRARKQGKTANSMAKNTVLA